MNATKRAVGLGLAIGLTHTLVRLYVLGSLSGGFTTATGQLLVQGLLSAGVSLAVIPGLPLYGALRLDADARPMRAAGGVGVGVGVGVLVSYPVITAASVGAPFAEALGIRLVGPYLVNAISPAVHSAVAALAGVLLAQRNA